MSKKRNIEVFSSGCAICNKTVELVQRLACDDCDINVLDMHDPGVAERAMRLGVRSVPAVAVNGRLVECCVGRGVDADALVAAGIGRI